MANETMQAGLTRKPHKGDRIQWGTFGPNGTRVPPVASAKTHTVVRTPEGDDDRLCWILEDGKGEALPFIWRFNDVGLNQLATIVGERDV